MTQTGRFPLTLGKLVSEPEATILKEFLEVSAKPLPLAEREETTLLTSLAVALRDNVRHS